MPESFRFSLYVVAVTVFILSIKGASLMKITPDQRLKLEKSMHIMCNGSETSSKLSVDWRKDNRPFPWFKDENRVSVEGSNITIKRATLDDLGEYTCHVGEPSKLKYTTKIYDVSIQKPFAKSYNLDLGGTLTLECKVNGYPLPQVTWRKDDEELHENDDERIKISWNETTRVATLQVENLMDEDRATYTCNAHNELASANTTTLVRVKDKLAALWPFLGICAEVIILVVIIFCYERKRAKSAEDEDDGDAAAAPSRSTDSGKGSDVRQRK